MLFVRYYLWVAPHILLAICLARLLMQRAQSSLPIFVSYVGFALLEFVVLFTLQFQPLSTYRWVLVAGVGITALLQLGVLNELAGKLLLSHSSLANSIRPLLRWSAAILVLAAAISSPSLLNAKSDRVMNVFQEVDFATSLIKVGLLLALLLFTRALHIVWRTLPAGIALGFGISASAEMAAAVLSSALGKHGYIASDLLDMGAFHICVVIWLIYIFLPDRPPNFTGKGLQRSEVEYWNQELQRMEGKESGGVAKSNEHDMRSVPGNVASGAIHNPTRAGRSVGLLPIAKSQSQTRKRLWAAVGQASIR